jgi:HD-GYP domain-containing protein (c-di-GMP phosphodiesterase class II)
MNTINTVDLRPGQVFTEAVYSEGENLLVPPLVPIRQKDIDFLFNWGIDVVTTEGTLAGSEEDEPPPLLLELEDVEIDIEEVEKEEEEEEEEYVEAQRTGPIKFSISAVRQNSIPYRAYKSLIEKLNFVFSSIKSGADIEMRAIDNIGTQLLQDLRDHQNSFIDFILGGEIMGHELAKSSINTAILSALAAQELKLPNHKIHNIVAGALLHDIGMLRLSKGITEKKGGLSDAELEQIKSHPIHTSKIITKELFGPHEVNSIALQHHERWDGKGYPDHLAGTIIDLGARIVSVADAFEAMVSKKSYRNPLVGYQAVKNLLADNARRFDPDVIMAFTKIMGIYPIGSILRLNDKSVARVMSVHREAPLRPVIQMLISKNGKVLKPGQGAIIDLLSDKTLYIKNAIDPEDFSLDG